MAISEGAQEELHGHLSFKSVSQEASHGGLPGAPVASLAPVCSQRLPESSWPRPGSFGTPFSHDFVMHLPYFVSTGGFVFSSGVFVFALASSFLAPGSSSLALESCLWLLGLRRWLWTLGLQLWGFVFSCGVFFFTSGLLGFSSGVLRIHSAVSSLSSVNGVSECRMSGVFLWGLRLQLLGLRL